MNEIDNLSGIDLAQAVAEARGWICLHFCGMRVWRDSKRRFRFYVRGYRPDRDIAQAWELNGDGRLRGLARVDFSDFPTPSAAYATARCRAWLMAQEVEG